MVFFLTERRTKNGTQGFLNSWLGKEFFKYRSTSQVATGWGRMSNVASCTNRKLRAVIDLGCVLTNSKNAILQLISVQLSPLIWRLKSCRLHFTVVAVCVTLLLPVTCLHVNGALHIAQRSEFRARNNVAFELRHSSCKSEK